MVTTNHPPAQQQLLHIFSPFNQSLVTKALPLPSPERSIALKSCRKDRVSRGLKSRAHHTP